MLASNRSAGGSLACSTRCQTGVTFATRSRDHQLAQKHEEDTYPHRCSAEWRPTAVKQPAGLGVYTLKYDGASKGNPGRAGAGALLLHPDGSLVCTLTEGVGCTTNNVAEYRALILGLREALERGISRLEVRGDSNLVCQQVNGKWKVKSPHLQILCDEVKFLAGRLETFSIAYIPRALNTEADSLANESVKLPEKSFVSTFDQRTRPDQQTASSFRGIRIKQGAADVDLKSAPSSNCTVQRNIDQAVYTLEFDGFSTGRPPRAGAGAILRHPGGQVVFELIECLGRATSNAAEYRALIIGLQAAQQRGISHVQAKGDSGVVCQQLLGQRIVTYHHIQLYNETRILIQKLTSFSILQIDCSINQDADALARKATVVQGSRGQKKVESTMQKEVSSSPSTTLPKGLHSYVNASNHRSLNSVPTFSTAQLEASCVSCKRRMSNQRLSSETSSISLRLFHRQSSALCGGTAAWLTKLGRPERPWTAAAKFVTQLAFSTQLLAMMAP